MPLEDVQCLAGHADPRTTRLYDRQQKKITRNIVERISCPNHWLHNRRRGFLSYVCTNPKHFAEVSVS